MKQNDFADQKIVSILKFPKILTSKLLLPVVLVAIIISLFYFSYVQFKNYKNSQYEQEKQSQLLIEGQKKALEKAKIDLEILRDSSQAAIKKLENQQESILSEQNIKIPSVGNFDLATIIKVWSPYVVYIECDFKNQNGVKYLTQTGSGFLSNARIATVYTNEHVLVGRGEYKPDSCRIFTLNGGIYLITPGNIWISNKGDDFGYLEITNPDNYLQNLNYSELKQYINEIFCTKKASIGDEVVILGYPSLGSTNDITATEGIISGYDGKYYITSAKVEAGNSGGVAILVKDNCYLGIPTFTLIGSAESLARILDFYSLFQ